MSKEHKPSAESASVRNHDELMEAAGEAAVAAEIGEISRAVEEKARAVEEEALAALSDLSRREVPAIEITSGAPLSAASKEHLRISK